MASRGRIAGPRTPQNNEEAIHPEFPAYNTRSATQRRHSRSPSMGRTSCNTPVSRGSTMRQQSGRSNRSSSSNVRQLSLKDLRPALPVNATSDIFSQPNLEFFKTYKMIAFYIFITFVIMMSLYVYISIGSSDQSYTVLNEKHKSVYKSVKTNIAKSIFSNAGRPDFALESLGGKVLKVKKAKTYFGRSANIQSWILVNLVYYFSDHAKFAQMILNPDVAPGQCWAFERDNAEIYLELINNIYIMGITIEHIPINISPTLEITSAPRKIDLKLYKGLTNLNDNNGFDFGTFTYDAYGPPVQYFDVGTYSAKAYSLVLLNVTSNWGNLDYTCIYRIQIHGESTFKRDKSSILN